MFCLIVCLYAGSKFSNIYTRLHLNISSELRVSIEMKFRVKPNSRRGIYCQAQALYRHKLYKKTDPFCTGVLWELYWRKMTKLHLGQYIEGGLLPAVSYSKEKLLSFAKLVILPKTHKKTWMIHYAQKDIQDYLSVSSIIHINMYFRLLVVFIYKW